MHIATVEAKQTINKKKKGTMKGKITKHKITEILTTLIKYQDGFLHTLEGIALTSPDFA